MKRIIATIAIAVGLLGAGAAFAPSASATGGLGSEAECRECIKLSYLLTRLLF